MASVLSTVFWLLPVHGHAQTFFANTNPITILDSDTPPTTASTYPSTISVPLSGYIGEISVTISNISHTWPDDIDMVLVGPGGQSVMLMSDCGANFPLTNLTLTFSDAAAANLPDASQIVSGVFKPTDFEPGVDVIPNVGTNGWTTNLSVFNGTSPNGAWNLYVVDDSSGDSGVINGGWSLSIVSAPRIDSLTHSGSTTHLSGTGEIGRVYTVQASTNLVQWDVLGSTSGNTNGVFTFNDTGASLSKRFYRLLVQ